MVALSVTGNIYLEATTPAGNISDEAMRMRELAAQYPRYGYRRIQVFLGRRGHEMSADRAHRLWRQHGLQVPRKRPRRRIATGRPRPLPATGAGYL